MARAQSGRRKTRQLDVSYGGIIKYDADMLIFDYKKRLHTADQPKLAYAGTPFIGNRAIQGIVKPQTRSLSSAQS